WRAVECRLDDGHCGGCGTLLESLLRLEWWKGGRDHGWSSAGPGAETHVDLSTAVGHWPMVRAPDGVEAGGSHFFAHDDVRPRNPCVHDTGLRDVFDCPDS